jgi:hypothetical protein
MYLFDDVAMRKNWLEPLFENYTSMVLSTLNSMYSLTMSTLLYLGRNKDSPYTTMS